MDEKIFDVAILGSGPGGYPAAIKLAQQGKKVALIEASEVGGTCLNRGCIPTKTLIAGAELLHEIRQSEEFGISTHGVSFDFVKMAKRKDDVVTGLRRSLEGLLKANALTVLSGFGVFDSPTSLLVSGKDACKIRAKEYIIATGSEPKEIPAFPFDGTHIHSSTTILQLQTLPKKLVIVGGGVIGCEFASLYAELGVTIHIIEALDRILPLESETVSHALTKSFQKRRIEVVTSSLVQEAKKTDKGVVVHLKNGKMIESDMALIAIGRSLNSSKIGLEKAGVKKDKEAIIIDDKMSTNISGIWAIGDVTGKSLYAHVATHQGLIAASNILGKPAHMNYDAVPGVIFTHPEIGTVGISLAEAKRRGYKAKVSKYPFQGLGKAQAARQTEGFVELITDEMTGQILGGQVMGHEASIMIAQIATAITHELTVESITETIHAHPTLPEAWMEAAFLAEGMPLHFPPITKK